MFECLYVCMFKYYLYGINAFSLWLDLCKLMSRRLFLVTLLDSRELKWSWPTALAISFPVLVFFILLTVPLWVLTLGIRCITDTQIHTDIADAAAVNC